MCSFPRTEGLRRSDFPLLVVLKDGREVIVLLEIQTLFRREFLWRLVDYCMRFRLRYRLDVMPVVLLLRPYSVGRLCGVGCLALHFAL